MAQKPETTAEQQKPKSKKPTGKAKKPSSGSRLSEKTVEQITKLAAEIAVEKYKEELRGTAQRVFDNRYNNTKVLIQKYRWLSDYANNAVYDLSKIDEDDAYEILELFGDRSAKKLESVKDRVYTVRMLMEHINTMLDVYKMRCLSSAKQEDQRRWKVLYAMYIDPTPSTAVELAASVNIHERTVYKDVDDACEELSTLFFGINWTQMLQL